jgi:hypothetical protein
LVIIKQSHQTHLKKCSVIFEHPVDEGFIIKSSLSQWERNQAPTSSRSLPAAFFSIYTCCIFIRPRPRHKVLWDVFQAQAVATVLEVSSRLHMEEHHAQYVRQRNLIYCRWMVATKRKPRNFFPGTTTVGGFRRKSQNPDGRMKCPGCRVLPGPVIRIHAEVGHLMLFSEATYIWCRYRGRRQTTAMLAKEKAMYVPL